MNNNDKNGACVTDDQDQPDVTGPVDVRPLVERKNIRRHRERAAAEIEEAVISREKLLSAREEASHLREDASHLREDAAHLREDAATSREQEIHTTEAMQVATEYHTYLLQQTNSRLVIATIEAQKMAEQLEIAKVELENAKYAAEKANLAKSNFLSSMSHELRTPLNAILGFAQLLESGSPNPTEAQAERLRQIIRAGWYLLELINDILDFAVIESGKLSMSPGIMSLSEIMDECRAMIEAQAKQRGIRISFLPVDSTWFVKADRTRLKQIILNLLTNAIKYNREQGTVEVKCTATRERIRINVKDSGAGLPPEKLQQLFQPFNRLGQENGSEEGKGIGLSMAKKLAELMDGTIGVESAVGVGSEFWVELNRVVAPQPAAENTLTAQPVPQLDRNTAPCTLLYVEDNPANLMLVEHIIKRHPHLSMLSAPDGELGIALARAHLPDVILMDINLPGISGIEAMDILRRDPATKHIPIVALSANAMSHDIETGLMAGFFRYLTKPIKVNEILSSLDEAIELSRRKSINTHETGQIP